MVNVVQYVSLFFIFGQSKIKMYVYKNRADFLLDFSYSFADCEHNLCSYVKLLKKNIISKSM